MSTWAKPFIHQFFELCSVKETVNFVARESTGRFNERQQANQSAIASTATVIPENNESFKQITDLVIDYCTLNTKLEGHLNS